MKRSIFFEKYVDCNTFKCKNIECSQSKKLKPIECLHCNNVLLPFKFTPYCGRCLSHSLVIEKGTKCCSVCFVVQNLINFYIIDFEKDICDNVCISCKERMYSIQIGELKPWQLKVAELFKDKW